MDLVFASEGEPVERLVGCASIRLPAERAIVGSSARHSARIRWSEKPTFGHRLLKSGRPPRFLAQPSKLARFSHAAGVLSGFDAGSLLDERMAGIQRPRAKVSTQACCSRDRSGASNTVAGRPRCFPRRRTLVASIADRVFIMLGAD
jgi:hypothetical protein